jgi:hypothetical protein
MNLEQCIDGTFTHEEKQREYLGASAVGHGCTRHVQYYWLQLLGRIPSNPIEPRARRIFDRGNLYETEMVKWMKAAGFIFEQDDEKLQFSDLDGKFKGHVDGILLTGPMKLQYPVLWECKCVNDKGFTRLKDIGVKTQYPKYYTQIQLYMKYCSLQSCLFSVINANTMSIYDELVAYDRCHADEMIDRVELIFDRTKNNKFVAKSESSWDCKFCDYKTVCKGE